MARSPVAHPGDANDPKPSFDTEPVTHTRQSRHAAARLRAVILDEPGSAWRCVSRGHLAVARRGDWPP
jgi:hypothetical protein